MKSLLTATCVAASCALSSAVWAAPKAKPQALAQSNSFVEPRARALFARATKLYSGVRRLRFNWVVRDEATKTTDARELRFDRAGRFWLRGQFFPGQFPRSPFAAIDGKTGIYYDEGPRTFIQEHLTPDAAREAVEHQLIVASAFDEGLVAVASLDPLEAGNLQEHLDSRFFQTLRATVLPSLTFGGETCDVVRIHETSRDSPKSALVTGQRTFWFARKDGRLMRWQTRSDGEMSQQTDSQVTIQEFNPKFGASEFAFTLPKGAQLETD